MESITLLPETIAQTDGTGPVVDLENSRQKLLVFTLGITRSSEQQSLEISVWGSEDRMHWGEKPLAVVPPKFYCGVYSILVNLAFRPAVKYLRVDWRMKRWSRNEAGPMFGFYAFAEESGSRLAARAVA
jgi:hypothetical protein